MISEGLVNHLIEQACSGDESAVAWLQEEHILPLSVCAASTASSTVELERCYSIPGNESIINNSPKGK